MAFLFYENEGILALRKKIQKSDRGTSHECRQMGLGLRGEGKTGFWRSHEYVLSTTMRRQHNNPRRCHTNHEEGELASRHLYTSYEWEEGKGGFG